ncbi:MAG: hypothetical protein H0U03_12890 [Actinobacteria bacterium]|nr:hypothetical protein [Actinomycetota bacterium]
MYRGWGVTVQKFETEYIEDAELLVIDGAISLGRDSEGALLFREVVEERKDGSTTRIEYSYHFIYRNQFLFRHDRDPDNHPEMPEHKHVSPGDDNRVASDRVTFSDVMDEAYAYVAELEGDGEE